VPKCRGAIRFEKIGRDLRWRNEKPASVAHLASRRIVMNALTPTIGPADYCDDGRRLRHKLQKLRWMGLEREADRLVNQIAELACQHPIVIPDFDVPTD
jgi:hypothetical protein